MFSICILLYGNYPALARRCLSSIRNSGGQQYVQDIRIALHNVSAETLTIVKDEIRAFNGSWPCPIIVYEPLGNVYKYPTMRRLVYDDEHPPAEYIMWFDDDSYISSAYFWSQLLDALPHGDMLGQVWQLDIQGRQWEWVQSQPWYNHDCLPATSIRFCQGAWWVIKTDVLRALNWPVPELKHCGGDSMLGEALRHGGYRIKKFDYGVRINANEDGQHSQMPRRGYTERVIGADYVGKPYDTSHHLFGVRKCLHPPN